MSAKSSRTTVSSIAQSPQSPVETLTTSAGLLDKLLVAGSVLLIVADFIIFSVVLTTKSDQLAYAAQQIVAGEYSCLVTPCQNNGKCVLTTVSRDVRWWTCTCTTGYNGHFCDISTYAVEIHPHNVTNNTTDSGNETTTADAWLTVTSVQDGISAANGTNVTASLISTWASTPSTASGVGQGAGVASTPVPTTLTQYCISLPCINGGTCNNQVNGYTCTCTVAYTGTTCQSAKLDLFCATRTNAMSSATSVLNFEYTTAITSPSSFNPTSNSMTAIATGLYWMHISVDVPAHTQARAYLTGVSSTLVIIKNHTMLSDVDTMTRQGIISLSAGQTVTMATAFPTAGASGYKQPYWASFRLDNLFSPLVFVSVARDSPVPAKYSYFVNAEYGRIMVNTGGAWNTTYFNTTFRPPVEGLYYFSYSVGVLGQQNTLSNSLTMSVITTVFQRQLSSGLINLLSDPLNPTGAVDFVSRTLLVYLYPSDVVWFKSRNGSAYSDPVNWQIAFHAFLYSPIYSPKIAWMVECSPLLSNAYGANTLVNFTQVTVNVGGAWNSVMSAAIAPAAGFYYLSLDITSCNTGNLAAELRVNGQTQFVARFLPLQTGGTYAALTSRGQSGILTLNVNDYMTISITPTSQPCFYPPLTAFTGLYLGT